MTRNRSESRREGRGDDERPDGETASAAVGPEPVVDPEDAVDRPARAAPA